MDAAIAPRPPRMTPADPACPPEDGASVLVDRAGRWSIDVWDGRQRQPGWVDYLACTDAAYVLARPDGSPSPPDRE